MDSTEVVDQESLLSMFDASSIVRSLEIHDVLILLLTVTILLRLINYHTVKWPPSVVLAFGSFCCTLLLFLLSEVTTGHFSTSTSQLRQIFSVLPDLVLNYMLGFLLFASASEVDMRRLRRLATTVVALSIFSTCISALVTGVLTFLLLFPFADIGIAWCLLYGTIVSPTDPIVIQSILKQDKDLLPEYTRYFVVGESLINDFMGVILYIVASAIVDNPELKPWDIVGIFTEGVLIEGALGIAVGLVLAWCAYSMIYSVEDHLLEVAITFALVGNVNLICRLLGASIPLASVTAGLFIGNFCEEFAFSREAKSLFREMWSLLDEALNSLLFLLIGATTVLYHMGEVGLGNIVFMLVGSVAISLLSRFISVAMPLNIITVIERVLRIKIRHPKIRYGPETVGILTWGGMRGGISIALVLSVPDAFAEHAVQGRPTASQLLFFMTFAVVIFSIGVQGLSFAHFVRAIQRVWNDYIPPPDAGSKPPRPPLFPPRSLSDPCSVFQGIDPLTPVPPLYQLFKNRRVESMVDLRSKLVPLESNDLRRSKTFHGETDIAATIAIDPHSSTDTFGI